MPEQGVQRCFVALAHGALHLRWQGEGPAVVLLHQSPQNGRMWSGLMAELESRYLVLAPDLPGFGFSAPLPEPSIRAFAEAVLEALSRLGIEHFLVFGMHTGGLVAAEMGRLAPQRVAAVLVDGYAWFDEDERQAFDERYLPAVQPRSDGGHLLWLWARMREQRFFFPWYDGRAEAALALAAPSAEANDALVRDVLVAGDGYRAAYRAALLDRERDRILKLRVPTVLFYRDDDVLAGHRLRLPPLPEAVRAEGIADRQALRAALVRELSVHARERPDYRLANLPARSDGIGLIATAAGSIACRWQGRGPRFELWLPCPVEGCPAPTPADGSVLLIDWPGQGASERGEALGREGLLRALAAIEMIGPLCGIRAFGAAAPLALEAAAVLSLPPPTLIRPWWLSSAERARLLAGLPDPRPQRAGGHLLEAWQWARDSFLFPPWTEASAGDRLPVAAPLPDAVHARFLRAFLPGPGFADLLSACLRPPSKDCRSGRVLEEHPALLGRDLWEMEA